MMRPPDAADVAAKAEALEVWIADRGKLVFRQPMLASLALYLDLIPVVDARLPTAATDGRAIYVNPYFLRTLSADERVFLLGHEVWHNALLHHTRQQGREGERWNLATDHEINHLLIESGLVMPVDGILFEEQRGQNAEAVYAWLEHAQQSELLLNGVGRGPRADVHLGPNGAVGIETDPANNTDPAADTDEANESDGRLFGPIADKVDAAFPGRADRRAAGDWPARIVAIAQQHRGIAGMLPGALSRLVEEVVAPKVPWQTLLREFVARATGGEVRWVPPSRRHVHRGLYLPSRRGARLSLAVAIDTSGSTAPDLPQFASELIGILSAFGRFEVRVICCDCEIHSDIVYTDANPPKLQDFVFEGAGGTDFLPVFERLALEPPTALVFLTDGWGLAPNEPPSYPVLWALTAYGEQPAIWGRKVELAPSPDTADVVY